MTFHWLSLLPSILLLLQQSSTAAAQANYNVTGYDTAPPDLSKYELEPFPSLKDENGNDLDAEAVRGTRLFGYDDCGPNEKKIIDQAYSDFYKLSHLDGLYANFAWGEQPAKEMWGNDADKKWKLSDDQKEEIRQIYDAASSIWSYSWTGRPPWTPNPPGRDLWIHVRCSGEKGDPKNTCEDRADPPPDNPNCPPPEGDAPRVESDMEAFSEQTDRWIFGYSQTTFCNRFFNNLKSLDEATTYAKAGNRQDNLENWNNRARVFFHELTHLAYFMNSPAKTPFVDDLLIRYGTKSKPVKTVAYGPFNVKVLRNYRGDAWYSAQNADTYAWYAMAMWAQKEIGHYPEDPKTKTKPNVAPRRANGDSLQNPPSANDADDEEGQDFDYTPTDGFERPGCGDKMDIAEVTIPILNASCVDDGSVIPSSVFSSDSNKVYKEFCPATINNHNTLSWMSDVFGNLNGNSPPSSSRIKRLAHMIFGNGVEKREDGPEQFTNWQFELNWVPEKDTSKDCYLDCPSAFAALAALSQCAQKGDGKNLMSVSGQTQVGCGTYGYTVRGIAIS